MGIRETYQDSGLTRSEFCSRLKARLEEIGYPCSDSSLSAWLRPNNNKASRTPPKLVEREAENLVKANQEK